MSSPTKAGSGGGGIGAAGKGSLTIKGAGTLDLTAANSFMGGVVIGSSGTLELGNSLGARGAISFAPGGSGTLLLDAGVTPTYVQINSFDSSNNFDLAGFDPATTHATFQNTFGPALIVKNGVAADVFFFDALNPAVDFTGEPFYVADDHAGGSIVSLRPSLVVGATIQGTAGNDVIDKTHTVVGQPFPTAEGDTLNGGGGSDTLPEVPVPTRSCSI